MTSEQPSQAELEVFWTDPEYDASEQQRCEMEFRRCLELDRNDRLGIIVLAVLFSNRNI